MIQRINYDNLPNLNAPFVHATKHNEVLYVSGLTAFNTEYQQDDLKSQTQGILAQLNNILQQEKITKENLIKLTIFVVDISQLLIIRQILFDFYEGYLPACSMVEVSKLIHSDLQIEIEAIIALSKSA